MVSSAEWRFPRPQVHGHRGCRGLFPENTLPAFLHALGLGVDVLEMDVVISADQQVVVAHEPWLSARLGLSPTSQPIDPRAERDYNIYQLSYSAIRQSPLGIVRHPSFSTQQQVATFRPLLSEVLHATELACSQLNRPSVGYSIEIKSALNTEKLFHPSPEIFASLVLQAIPAAVLARVTLLSFDERILQVVRQRLQPALRLCLLVETNYAVERLFEKLGFIPDVFGPDFQLLSLEVVKKLRYLYPNLAIVPWTINQLADLGQAMKWQVDGLTTDYPERAISMLLSM